MNDKTLIHENPDGYELEEQLGRGGFGTVFRARQQSTGQTVAVKMLRLDDTDERDRSRIAGRFERETRLCADLDHPNIVRLLDKGRTKDNYLFAVFEYVRGETLRDLLLREGALPAQKAGNLMGQVLDGLACAHQRGIVHRDLKPSNIMITPTGTRRHVKILDFGIGTFVPDARKSDYRSLTLSRETVGTPSYSAPEQLRGEPPTVGSDLYAWGLVFIECLTGRAVMRGATLAEIFHNQLSPDDVPLPPAILGHPLADLLRRVLHKNQMERTCRADQIYSDFQKLNLGSIVGKLQREPAAVSVPGNTLEITETFSSWPVPQTERRQISVLCCSLGLAPVAGTVEPDFEALDALQRDLLSRCMDTGARYGGYAAGSLGDSVMMFFGYPQVSDNDARCAARTALEIAGQMRRRSALLAEQQNVRPEFRIGIHSGMVTTRKDFPPSGITPNIALRLQNLAPFGSILVSDETRKLLRRYIEFEPAESYMLGCAKPVQTYLLTGERQAEAFSFLHTGPVELPMVGRDMELGALLELWEKAEKKHGGAALLRGEPGIGKSRLAYEMRRLITDKGFGSIVCRFLPEHRNNALFPVLEMLKSRLRLHEASSPDEAARRLEANLKQCSCRTDWSVPILCAWLSLPLPEAFSPVPHSPERQKQILLGVVEELILGVSRDSPLLIIAEDLHWADQVSLELLNRLMTRIGGTGQFILMTARPEFLVPWETERLNTIELARISHQDSESMIRKLAGDRPVDRSALDTIFERTDGVPLFIEELVRMMLDREHLVERNGVYCMHEGFDTASVPITLQDLLNAKLGHLGPAKETAQVAAAIGREFDYSLLLRVSFRDEASLQTDLDLMAASGLVYWQRRVEGENYIFRHALIRDSAYKSMPQSARAQIHSRIAMALENDFPEKVNANPAGLAHHFAEGGIYEKAVSWGTRAANTALERSLNDEAIHHADRVLEWTGRMDPKKQHEPKLVIYTVKASALMGKHGWADPRVKACVEASMELFSYVEKNELIMPVLWSHAMYNHVTGNRHELRILIDKLVEIAEKSGDRSLQAAVESLLGLWYQSGGQFVEAARALEQAVRLYDPGLHKNHGMLSVFDTRVWAAGMLGIVYWFSGYNEIAVEYGENAISWARELKHIPSLAIALLHRGAVTYNEGDRDGAAGIVSELLDLTRKYGLTVFEGYATVMHCWRTGNAELAESVLDKLHHMGCRLSLALDETVLADIKAQNGDLDGAIAQIDKCLSLCRDFDWHSHEPLIHKRRAMYLLKKYPEGSPDIRASLIKAAELARSRGMFRIEAEAIHELLRVFGPDKERKNRLDEILAMRPEIGPTLI